MNSVKSKRNVTQRFITTITAMVRSNFYIIVQSLPVYGTDLTIYFFFIDLVVLEGFYDLKYQLNQYNDNNYNTRHVFNIIARHNSIISSKKSRLFCRLQI